MATPPPPPRDPSFLPPRKTGADWRLFLKIALVIVAGFVLLLVVGVGLVLAACSGLFK